jgi:hypothetical protein
MAYIKGRHLNPERGEGYHGSFLGIAGEAIAENDIVVASGYSGDQIKFSLATSDVAGRQQGIMGIAKHAASADETVVILSHKLVKDVDTSSAAAVGYPVYLDDDNANTGGWIIAEQPNAIVVGQVLAKDASAGAVLLAPSKIVVGIDGDGDPVP